ncbi:MAG: hypothetical protein WD114_06830 [Phycisphaerales bacterium]
MSNHDTNRTFKTDLLGMGLRQGIMPALVLAMLAGSATAQDSGGFGLLAALKNQAKAGSQQSQPETEELEDFYGDESELYYEDYEGGEMSGTAAESNEDDLEELAGAVDVSEYDLVDLHVNNEDLGNILQLLSIQSQRNIISSNNVKATVTADLYGVSFYEALDSILHVNGNGYIEKGNFIYVYTAEELAEFEALSRRPMTRIIDLDYLNATDAAEFAKMLLSESGTITSNAATEAFTLAESPTGADNYASSATIVISDFQENIDEIEALIAELDTKPAQVLVEATILQTSLTEANAFGMDFSIISDMDIGDFLGESIGGPLNVVDAMIGGVGETIDGTAVPAAGADGDGFGVGSNVGNLGGPSTLKLGVVSDDVSVFLRVLDQVTDVTVVSNPKLLTLNRQPAKVLVGRRVGYLNTTTTDTSTSQSVEFLEVGTTLSVRPFVSKSGLIRLELRPEVSNYSLRTEDGNTIPDKDETSMTTNVMLRDGQTAVLGGLFTERTTSSRRQVPVLGDIPLIGQGFRGNDDNIERSEIIFMITPSIINDTVLAEAGDMGNQYVEHARYGARKGLLPWSRERRVGQFLIEARDLADEGRIEEALSKVDRALRLMPTSPDARALRTELTGEMRTMPSRSIMEGMLNDELHFSDPAGSVDATGTIDPFATPLPEFTEAATAEGPEANDGATTESATDAVAEVPTGQVSSGYDDFELPAEDVGEPGFALEDTNDDYETWGYSEDEGFTQFTPDQAGDQTVDQTAAVEGPVLPETVENEAAAGTGSSFDQMKAVVTGEQTGVELPATEATQTADASEDDGIDPFVTVADGFSGQLIIPLPGGGALRLDWPLGYDYVVSDDDAAATFTDVPTGGDDFADFTE